MPFTLNIPQFTEEAKKVALLILNAELFLDVDGERQSFAFSEINDDLLRAEAERLANLPDPIERASAIRELLATCFQMVATCQAVASHVVTMADELHIAGEQAKAILKALSGPEKKS